jgi:NAD(P)-dependent dehydrogenase (short-subunit alcohol dehydrogenase family)
MATDPKKAVVITGAAGHLGRAIALWWAKTGASLVLVDRDRSRLEECRGSLTPLVADAYAIAADLAAPGEIEDAVSSLPGALWASPPTLVLAHGVAGRTGSSAPRLGELRSGDWTSTIDANLSSMVFAIQAFLPAMKQAGGGRIVLVSSAAALAASPTAALSYAVSKAGVAALPRLLAPELGTSGILINAVAPGKFGNPDWPDSPEQVARYSATVPLGRLASVGEVAALIGFLGSDANTYLTGETILQDGGRLAGLARSAAR